MISRLRGVVRWTLSQFPCLRPLAHLLAYYPALLLILLPLYGLIYGFLMADYDAFHLVWSDHFGIGLLNGVVVALLLGGVLLAVQRLDIKFMRLPPEQVEAVREQHPLMLWPKVRHYWYAWWVLIVAAALPVGFSRSQFRVEYPVAGETATCPTCGDRTAANAVEDRPATPIDGDGLESIVRHIGFAMLWFPLGMVAAIIVFSLFTNSGRTGDPYKVGLWLAVPVSAGFFLLLGVYTFVPPEHDSAVRDLLPASIPVFLLLGFFTVLITAITWFSGWYLLRPILLAVLVAPFLIPACQTRHRVPGLEIGAGPETYYDDCKRTNLWCYDELRARPRTDFGLVEDEAALKAWNDRMVARYGGPRPVVVVSVSGGASASALYTADVLFTLERESPGFSDQVRIITGASGGMLGASYFVSQFHPASKSGLYAAREAYAAAWKKRFFEQAGTAEEFAAAEQAYKKVVEAARQTARTQLGNDFLRPIIQQWIHKDMPLAALPVATINDRGMALELAWRKHLDGALHVPFKQFREAEQAGQIPSIVFTPMMIEDGRQLIISNLDLDYMVDSVVPETSGTDVAQPKVPTERPSHTGMEFYRLFPKADQFTLATAVRLNASFPYLSPSPALPTNPERHVVDAGYYDNYGTLTATKWAIRNLNWLNNAWWRSYTRAYGAPNQPVQTVFLVQVRCFAFEGESRSFVRERECAEVRRRGECGVASTESGWYSLSAPVFGLLSSWRANMVYRGDERVDATQIFSRHKTADPEHPGFESRVERVLYECPFEPSLNWTLTDATRWRLRAGSGRQIEGEFGGVRTTFDFARRVSIPPALQSDLQALTALGQGPPDRSRSPAAARREFY